jgi:hypothetical protein
MAKTLRDKLKPTLVADGVFYPTPLGENVEPLIILEEVKEETGLVENYLNNNGYVLGFRAYSKTTPGVYNFDASISKGIGNPKIYLIVDNHMPIDYATSLKLAKDKAHEYILNKIINQEILECSDIHTNLLDTTKIGIRKAKKNKVNLSERKGTSSGSLINMEEFSKTERNLGTPTG